MAPSSRYYEEKKQREEERRQKELERRKEEAAERQRAEEKERLREEERREEARREALEFEAALEQARLKREEMLARLRLQKRMERKETDREIKRRDDLLAALREANRDKQREETRKERTKERQTQEKETTTPSLSKEITPQQKNDETRKEARALEERRRATLEEARKKASASRKKQAELLDKEQSQKQQTQLEMRESLARERLKERKREETDSETEEKRRTDLIKKRMGEFLGAQRSEERKADALATRKKEQEEELKEAERREEARRVRLQEQKQERERTEREAERKEQRKEELKARRIQEQEERARTPRQLQPSEKPAPSKPLESRLPSGVLSGNLPWLLTYDNMIVTTEGEVVFLRGINLPALDEFEASEHASEETGTDRIDQTVSEILSWGANVIRLGVSSARLVGGESTSHVEYLALLDRVIAASSQGNCYTIVHLVEDPAESPADAPYLSALARDDVIAALLNLAERYASEPAVLLDLGCPPRDLLQGEAPSRESAWAAWNGLIPNLVADLRERHPRAFCFAGGLYRATDMSGFPVTGPAGRPIPGLAYRVSVFPGTADPWAEIRSLALSNPVFVSEWGGATIDMARDLAWNTAWGERVAVMMETMGIGWAAAFPGEVALVKPVPHGPVFLTPFGAVVKRALALANARAEAGQLTRFSTTM